ncbi:MAG: penicillin-binding protein 2 [Cyanobacteriota bacterium]|nr:penicillin-binding protein 2 [Cyanobacteriota bacterium]
MASRSSASIRHRRTLAQFTRVRPQPRIILVWALLMLAMIALAGRLVWLQLVQAETLADRARAQRQVPNQPYPQRYPISDRQGNLLALDQTVYTLYGHPQLFNQPVGDIATLLSPLLDQPVETLLVNLAQRPTGIRLANQMAPELATQIRQLRIEDQPINGLELVPQQQRFYPPQELFAPIVGFVNWDGEAQAGLEIAQAERLTRPDLERRHPLEAMTAFQSEQATLKLTLDSRLQRVAQQALAAVVKTHQAKRGAVLVMEVNTGAMLALATVPTYNPNHYYKADMAAFKNWAISDLYEPGSTFKPINIAIALESGVISPEQVLEDSGQIRIGKWTIKNHDYDTVGARGPISLTDVLKYSSNVAMVRIMQKLPPTSYFDWLAKLGLNQPSGIDLPNEGTGHLKNREEFIRSKVEPATTAFGQGFSITPIKLLQLQAALANGGKLVTPHLIDSLVSATGDALWVPDRPPAPQVFSPQTSQQVMGMMAAVVDEGTGSPAQVAGYRIGGKTGTAQKANPNGGYGRGRITSFIGILPSDRPRYAVLAVIDEPQGDNAYGSTVAAPLVKQVMESLAVLQGMPPMAAIEKQDRSL